MVKEDDNDAVKVVVRVKPLSDKGWLMRSRSTLGEADMFSDIEGELRKKPWVAAALLLQTRTCIQQTSDYQLRIGVDPQVYTFDKVAGEHCSQEEIFRAAGESLVDRCLEGFNCCVFTYGQTGSGKTWTMWGQLPDYGAIDHLPPQAGLIPRMYRKLFIRVAEEEKKLGGKVKFTCKCSIVEIYNETITDLLNPDSGNLPLRESKKDGVYIEGVSERRVDNVAGVMDLVSEGSENRQVAETNMNHESSRSHVVLACSIAWKTTDENGIVTTKCSRLNLVDLAGSERQKATGAKGDRLKEACGINKSLSTLGHVIMSLADLQSGKDNHVPYRDSKLTFLLQDSLGGNSKTVMIANLSPSLKNMDESLSTLRFARGAKKIKNKAVINESHGGDVTALREEIARLKAEVAQLRYREAERTTQGHVCSTTPTSLDSFRQRSGSVTPTSTTITLSDSKSDMMEDLEEVYTLRVEKNCASCQELTNVLRQVWDEKVQVLEDSILLAAQLTAARFELDAVHDEGHRAVEDQKRQGEQVIAELVAELELVKGARKEDNPSQMTHAQKSKMALARRRSMKAVHSSSCDFSSEGASPAQLGEMPDEEIVLKQLSLERNLMETAFGDKFPEKKDEGGAEDLSPSESSPTAEQLPSEDIQKFKKTGSLVGSAVHRDTLSLGGIQELPEEEGRETVMVQSDSSDEVNVQVSADSLTISSHMAVDGDPVTPRSQCSTDGGGKAQKDDITNEEAINIESDDEGGFCTQDSSDVKQTGEVVTSTGPTMEPMVHGTVGMTRSDTCMSYGVRDYKDRAIQLDSVPVPRAFSGSMRRRRGTFLNWFTCCFGGKQ